MAQQASVKKYKGERELRKGLEKMAAEGWAVQTQTSRKSWWRLWTGPFTRRQIHTVTFVKQAGWTGGAPPMPM